MSGPFTPDNTDVLSEQVIQQKVFSRTDIATTRRALHDLNSQASKLSDDIKQSMATEKTVSMDAFKNAWEKRERLNDVQEKIESIRKTLSDVMPPTSSVRLSVDEKKQIVGLYQSGLYTQQQLAEQYGITQPSIGDIIKKEKKPD